MFRDFLTNKWVLGGVGFLIVLSIACVLWYQHDTAPYRKAAAEAEELLRQSELSKESEKKIETEPASKPIVESEAKTTAHQYTGREDKHLNIPPSNTDAWIQSRSQRDPQNTIYDEEDLIEAAQNTNDPIVQAELLHAQLIKTFGDRPEVHTIRQYQIDTANGIPSNVDKQIEYLEAHYALFKDESFLQAIEEIRQSQKDGVTIIFK
ncbi:MAG: hypothetical protein OXI67_10060 [Candidatus Poribacteria bacterium]|nr:hypothetical protein [Candidatus Poribacteria bacterium]